MIRGRRSRVAASVVALLAGACSAPVRPAPVAPPAKITPSVVTPSEPPTMLLQQDATDDFYALSPDGSLVASLSQGGASLQLWSVAQHRLVGRASFPARGAFAPTWGSSGRIVTAIVGTSFCLWDVTRHLEASCHPIELRLPPVWSPDRTLVAVQVGDLLRILDARTAEVVHERRGFHGADVLALGASGSRVVVDADRHNQIWPTTGEATSELQFPPGGVDFSRDERYLAVQTGLEFSVFDVTRKEPLARAEASAARFAPTGARLALLSAKGRVQVWEPGVAAADGALRTTSERDITTLETPGDRFLWIDSDRLAIAKDDHLALESLATHKVVPLGDVGPDELERTMQTSADKSVSVLLGRELRLVDLATGSVKAKTPLPAPRAQIAFKAQNVPVALFPVLGPSITDFADGPALLRAPLAPEATPGRTEFYWSQGKLVASCSNGVARWDVKTGAQAFHPWPALSRHSAVRLQSLDGSTLAVLAQGILSVSRDDQRESFRTRSEGAALSHDGALVLGWTGAEAILYDGKTGAEVRKLRLPGPVEQARFSPTTATVAIQYSVPRSSGQHAVFIHDPERGVLDTLTSATVPRFSPDGSRLAASASGAVLVWSTSSWAKPASFRVTSSSLQDILWSPDGSRLVPLSEGAGRYGALPTEVLDAATGARVANVRVFGDVDWLSDSRSFVDSSGRGAFLVRVEPRHLDEAKTVLPGEAIQFRSGLRYVRMVNDGTALTTDGASTAALVRLADGAELWVEAAESPAACRLFAFDEEGRFDGEPLGRITYREGNDLRTARVDGSPATLDAHRVPGLVASFLAPSPR